MLRVNLSKIELTRTLNENWPKVAKRLQKLEALKNAGMEDLA